MSRINIYRIVSVSQWLLPPVVQVVKVKSQVAQVVQLVRVEKYGLPFIRVLQVLLVVFSVNFNEVSFYCKW